MKTINMEENRKQQRVEQHCEELYGKKISLFNHETPQYSILHIDDDETLLDVSRLFLKELVPSIQVNSTTDTSNVCNLLETEFDCIIVDYAMPPSNGLEVCKRIRELKQTPIILFTGQDKERLPLEEFQKLDVKYIQKGMDPCNYYQLVDTILTLVNSNLEERNKQTKKVEYNVITQKQI